MTYTTIKSKFVNGELKKTKWKNRQYINHLLDFEKFATTGYCSTGAGYILSIQKCKYPAQWKAIWLELNPKAYRKDIESEKKEREREKKEAARFKQEEALELKRDRAEWKKEGGLP